ncbi:MAG: sigma-70 family RNA polymerase sigma factor [Polyangiaceae bacterium]|nr:sigma-70 family RNA polymerase sigma factor [Polyangiaceae bacterium]
MTHDTSPPAVYLTIEMIIALTAFIRAVLRRCGVREADIEDIGQIVIYSAYFAAKAGAYCPDPARDPKDVLRAWIAGICWRHASNHNCRAHVRREIPAGLCPGEGVSTDPRARIEACDAVATLRHLGRVDREMLLARADGESITAIAEAHDVPYVHVRRRIERSRRIIAAIISKGAVR